MQQDEQAALDIFHRNTHLNIFRIKIPSHNSSKQNLDSMASAFTLNKLALLPFHQNQKLTQLYRLALEFLINSDKERYKNNAFVEAIIFHLLTWQINMSIFGVWPYTRACFYSIESKLKQNQETLEKTILQRGILQPSKQQFMNRCQNMNFKSEDLRLLINLCRREEDLSVAHKLQLPYDILYLDVDECWIKLMEDFNNNNISSGEVSECLIEYDRTYVLKYLRKNMNSNNQPQILDGLRLRSKAFTTILNQEATNLEKTIKVLLMRLNS